MTYRVTFAKSFLLFIVVLAATILFLLAPMSKRRREAREPSLAEPSVVEARPHELVEISALRQGLPSEPGTGQRIVADELLVADDHEVPGGDPSGNSEPRESWREIQHMLADKKFLEACTRRTDIETAVLESLVEKANNAIDLEVSAEVEARVAAGLFTPLPGYAPGVEFKLPKRDKTLYGTYVFTPTGEALDVHLMRADYPQLYELSDRMGQLETELEVRRRAR